MPSSQRPGQPTDSTVRRVVLMLDLLADAPPEGVGVRAAAESTGLSKSAVQRLLQSLCELDVAEQLPSGRYLAGGQFVRWAASSAVRSGTVAMADQVMQDVVRQYGETVYLTRLLPASAEAVFVHVVESDRPLRYVLPLGQRIPLHAGAAGKAILSELGDNVVDKLTLSRFTARTIIDRPTLKAELKLIRERGYATSMGERIEGAAGVAAAYWRNGRVIGSITLTVPQQSLDDERLAELGNAMRKAAERLSFPSRGRIKLGDPGQGLP